jgi:Mn-dependent DtxR family transcriptional regulator
MPTPIGGRRPPTPTQEDYLKAIWLLIQEKGYARVSDIADRLGLSYASVSRMVRRLGKEGLTTYVPYRGLNLTTLGQRRGRMLVERQRTLQAWLTVMGLGPGHALEATVEGIEHHFGPEALSEVTNLVRYVEAHPAWWRQYRDWAGAQGQSGLEGPGSDGDHRPS